MDKAVLKKFATESRRELMEKVANKINRYFVDEEFNVNQNGEVYVLVNDKHTLRLTKSEYENRQLLVKRIKEITLGQVIEEAAYTWFNRIIAIRYMEIHDYLPLTKDNQSLGVRVLSSKDNTPDPEIMKISNLLNPDLDIEFDKEYYGTIQDNNKRFEYILLLVCKKLGKVIPQVFDGITDYIDILIPDNLLNESGYITKLLKEVAENNFNEVEIIGWLYQYYISEKKAIIFDNIKKNIKVDKNNIPAATQLFTPNWIVKYMVENSLGKYWIEKSKNRELIEKWEYYIDNNYNNSDKIIEPKTIKFLDPCCGSGNILIYAFEIFFQIYNSIGYNKSDIPEIILKNNIFGIDLDDRASQLTILAILLKAREYDKKIFNKKITRELNIYSIYESNSISKASIDTISDKKIQDIAKDIIKLFYDAKEVGSLLKVDETKIENYKKLESYILENDTIFSIELKEKMLPLIKLTKMLADKYDIVVTNPPYMGKKSLNTKINKYIEKNYEIGKSELYSAFMVACNNFTKANGIQMMITIHTWMFISSFKNLRKYIIDNLYIENMMHLGPATFEELNSFNVLATAFSFRNQKAEDNKGTYIKLDSYLSTEEKIKEFYNKNNRFEISQELLKYIKDYPIVYWISDKMRDIFKNQSKLEEFAEPRVGLQTGENAKFVRNWYEIDFKQIGFNYENCEQTKDCKFKWFPYNNGGNYRKWYGNNEAVVDWYDDGRDIKEDKLYKLSIGKCLESNSKPKNTQYYFLPGITWSIFGFSNFGVRIKEKGFIFDVSGSSGFPNEDDTLYILAFLASKVSFAFLSVLAPTVNFQTGNIADLPLKITENKEYRDRINKLALENIELSKKDWDNFELSWNFKNHPLLCSNSNKIEDAYKIIEKEWNNNFYKLKSNEEKLNDLFIKIYDISNEITPEIDEKDITIRKANQERETKSLISYAVGCMFGRFSLNQDGLICTNNTIIDQNYGCFMYDKDNIIPITEDNYFEDDIVSRFKKFIEIVYGKESLYENLDFIADTLGKKTGENSEETIRRYFINDFYNDHIKMYQKRPIYWLFDSGKKNGFKCLIYMHRYNEGLVSKIRLDYLHRMQNTYEKELKDISEKLNGDVDLTSKRELSKRQADISAKLQEANEYDEKIAHIADQKIKIDLDDGVAVNYAKFSVKNPKTGKEESILAKIK